MSGEIWSAAGVVLAALVAYFGVRYTSQQSARANRASADMENKAIDAAAFERARESYEAAIRQYLSEISRLETRIGSLTDRIAALNDEILHVEETKRHQREDLEKTREALERVREDYEEHMRWCNEKVERLQQRLDGVRDAEAHLRGDDLSSN